jgi:hypothetical protein
MLTTGGEYVSLGGDFLPLGQRVYANYTAGGAGAVYSVPCDVAVPQPSGVSQPGMTMSCGPTLPGVGVNMLWSFFAGASTAIPVSGSVAPVSSCESRCSLSPPLR